MTVPATIRNIFRVRYARTRALGMLALTLVSLLLVPQTGCFAAARHKAALPQDFPLDNPVFGDSHTPLKQHWELVSKQVAEKCSFYDPTTKDFIYAYAKEPSGEYYVTAGLSPGQDGDSFGSVLRVNGNKCDVDEAKWTLSGHVPAGGYPRNSITHGKLLGDNEPQICHDDPDFPHNLDYQGCYYMLRSAEEEKVLQDLASDALARGVRAFGGEAQFKKHVCVSSNIKGNWYTPVIQQALIKFCQ